ncbi:MAG: HEPN domain-containing protein [Candidatus Goldbacteria bacterium]|nr:HEPN domain-containing protein [Candidatus Goldiibacteriota bacterium]
MDSIRTSRIDRHLYVNFIRRSKECINTAADAYQKKDYNAGAICSVHSAISAADALCVYYLQKRHTGLRHDDAVRLLESIKDIPNVEIKEAGKRLKKIISMKNMAEYEERLIKQKEAENLLENAKVLFEFIKSKLPE